MSTQRGNSHRTRPQKHKNLHRFNNKMHDTTNLTQMLNNLEIYGVCTRCKEQIDWRIKYKKYKPLAAPKKCVKCEQKTVRRAYTVACAPCGSKLKLCVKCLKPKELVEKSMLTPEEENQRKQEFEAELRVLPERKRRALERSVKAGNLSADWSDSANPTAAPEDDPNNIEDEGLSEDEEDRDETSEEEGQAASANAKLQSANRAFERRIFLIPSPTKESSLL